MFLAQRVAYIALGLALVLASASAQYEYCTTAHVGNVNAQPVVLQPTKIGAGVGHAEVDVPSNACGSEHVVGLNVRVCDSDVTPRLRLPSPYVALVYRAGSLVNYAPVDMTVYCGNRMQGSGSHMPKVQIHHN